MQMRSLAAGSALLALGLLGNAQAAVLAVDATSGLPVETNRTVANGSTFTVDVYVDAVLDLAGFQFLLTFDPSLLMAASVVSGDLFGLDTFLIDDSIASGSVSFAEVSLGTGLDIGSATLLASVGFSALGEGIASLSLTDVELSDSANQTIAGTTTSGAQIDIAAAPLPPTLALLAVGLGALRHRRR